MSKKTISDQKRYVNWNSNIKDYNSVTDWFKTTFSRQSTTHLNSFQNNHNNGLYDGNNIEFYNNNSNDNSYNQSSLDQFDNLEYFHYQQQQQNNDERLEHIICDDQNGINQYINHSQKNISDLIRRFSIYLTKGDTSFRFNNINEIEIFRNEQLSEIMNILSENNLHLYFLQLNVLNQSLSTYTQNCISFTINSNCIIFKYAENVEFLLNIFDKFEKISHIVLSLISTDIYLSKYDSEIFENAANYFKNELELLDEESTWFIKLCRAYDQNYTLDLNLILKIIDEQKICANEVILFLKTRKECQSSIGWAVYWSSIMKIICNSAKYEKIQDEIGKIRIRLYNEKDIIIFDLKFPIIYEEVLLATMAIWNVKLFIKYKNIYDDVISNPVEYFKKTIENLEKDIIFNKGLNQ